MVMPTGGRGKTEKDRDAGAGTKGRDRAEQRAPKVAKAASLSRKVVSDTLHVQRGAYPGNGIYQRHQQQKNFYRIVNKKLQRSAQARFRGHAEQTENQPMRSRENRAVGQLPEGGQSYYCRQIFSPTKCSKNSFLVRHIDQVPDALFSILREGRRWRALPPCFGHWTAVFMRYKIGN